MKKREETAIGATVIKIREFENWFTVRIDYDGSSYIVDLPAVMLPYPVAEGETVEIRIRKSPDGYATKDYRKI